MSAVKGRVGAGRYNHTMTTDTTPDTDVLEQITQLADALNRNVVVTYRPNPKPEKGHHSWCVAIEFERLADADTYDGAFAGAVNAMCDSILEEVQHGVDMAATGRETIAKLAALLAEATS